MLNVYIFMLNWPICLRIIQSNYNALLFLFVGIEYHYHCLSESKLYSLVHYFGSFEKYSREYLVQDALQ